MIRRRLSSWRVRTVAPDAAPADVVSLFSDGYASALDGVGKTGWSVSGDVTEIDVNGNTFKKFDDTLCWF